MDFEIKKNELKLNTKEGIKIMEELFYKHTLSFPRRFASTKNAIESTGNNLEDVSNCVYCFSATDDENVRYSFFVPTGGKDSYDIDHVGLGVEYAYELHSGFGDSNVYFSNRVYSKADKCGCS